MYGKYYIEILNFKNRRKKKIRKRKPFKKMISNNKVSKIFFKAPKSFCKVLAEAEGKKKSIILFRNLSLHTFSVFDRPSRLGSRYRNKSLLTTTEITGLAFYEVSKIKVYLQNFSFEDGK